MTLSHHTVLLAVVEAAEAADGPVTVSAVAEDLDVPESALSEPLESLSECELLEATGAGYRPTVTAHELLELDVDIEDVLVLDIVEE